jgi:hypothetical protein
MITRDGNVGIFPLQSQKNLPVTTKRCHTSRIKHFSSHLPISSQDSSVLPQSCHQTGGAEVPNAWNLFIMQRRIISFTLRLFCSRIKDPHYSGNSEFVVACCWFIPCRSSDGFAQNIKPFYRTRLLNKFNIMNTGL